MALEHDVADLEQKLASLQVERDALLSESAAQNQELITLRIEALVARATSKRESNRSEAMFTILNQVSVLLIQGIKRMEARDREERLRAQEDRLGVGDEDMPPIGGFRTQMERAHLPTPTRRAMHFEGKRPSFEVAGQEGDVVHDIDSPNVWEWTRGAWQLAGTRPAPNPGGPREPTVAPVSEAARGLPAAPAPAPAPARPGTVRNDIVDKRLPLVEFGPDDDQRALGELAATVLKRGG
jgi:hypothetical protein